MIDYHGVFNRLNSHILELGETDIDSVLIQTRDALRNLLSENDRLKLKSMSDNLTMGSNTVVARVPIPLISQNTLRLRQARLNATPSDVPGLWNVPGYPELTTAQFMALPIRD